jgi:hypothetical protein
MTHLPIPQTENVDPARLAPGQWCHRRDKTIGEGDIHASYSADRIGMAQPVRKPFSWKGAQWVCVSFRYSGDEEFAEAYRLVARPVFDGEPVSYAAKTADGEAARADPNGFYHGMTVRHGGQDYVLCGPPFVFIPGEAAQLSLF